MTEEKKSVEDGRMKYKNSEEYKDLIARQADAYENELECCEVANTIVQMLAQEQWAASRSLYILNKAIAVIDESTREAVWGQPLMYRNATGTVYARRYGIDLYYDEVMEEINRRKQQ
jgi:hypothetical protein